MKPAFRSGVRAYMLRMQRRHAWPVITVPFLGTLALLGWRWDPSPGRVALFVGFYLLSVLGITVGFHRLLTHGAFSAPDGVRVALAILGCLAAEGSPSFWIANHRAHHHNSDRDGDPHSPAAIDGGLSRRIARFVHAHVGWMLTEPPADPLRYAPDLLRDRSVGWVNRRYLWFVAAGLVAPAVIGAAAFRSASGFLDGLLWGGLLRLFVAQHVTWCINSVCHLFGSRPWDTRDDSRNNALLGLLALGEGWHNNHHAAPTSAAHGLWWWQIDVSFAVIRALQALGLARDVRVADRRRLPVRGVARLPVEPA